MNRENSKKQSAIDQGIVMFDRGEIENALAFLESNDIPGDVIQRVLYNPDRRRQYINDYLSGF